MEQVAAFAERNGLRIADPMAREDADKDNQPEESTTLIEAVVMAPIARDLALSLGVNVDPFLMAVAVGASCAFLTPIGHQSNTLVMGPGGYKFGDYWRMGLPLEVLIVLLGVPAIMLVRPL